MVFDQMTRSRFEQAALTHGMNKRTNITTDILAEGSVDAWGQPGRNFYFFYSLQI